MDLSFFKNKTVLLTGHTGFKGSWMSQILIENGTNLIGYSLNPPTTPNLFETLSLENRMTSVIADIRDREMLLNVVSKYQPEIIIHMAAQPIVRDSYKDPVYTYETNVMGTVNIMEAVRINDCVKSFLNVTTDKVYLNREWEWGYREDDPLDGYDPYSNSKSCSEMVTHSYKNSFFSDGAVAISTARAGNVIGGGDFANDRIIPDCVRAAKNKENIVLRNPNSTRPYQHVLEPVMAYLMIVQKQYQDKSYAGYYNVGPNDTDNLTTGNIASLFCDAWGDGLRWIDKSDLNAPHEANFLKLDCSKIKTVFDWKPKWSAKTAVEKTVEWSKVYFENGDIIKCTSNQISEFIEK